MSLWLLFSFFFLDCTVFRNSFVECLIFCFKCQTVFFFFRFEYLCCRFFFVNFFYRINCIFTDTVRLFLRPCLMLRAYCRVYRPWSSENTEGTSTNKVTLVWPVAFKFFETLQFNVWNCECYSEVLSQLRPGRKTHSHQQLKWNASFQKNHLAREQCKALLSVCFYKDYKVYVFILWYGQA